MAQKKIKHTKGITLLELLVSVAIVGILASVAYPSYIGYIVKSNRTEAQRELVKLANLQEQYFIDHRTYTTNMELLGMASDPYITASGNYSIDSIIESLEGVEGGTFTLTATAKNSQASQDSSCVTLSIDEKGTKSAKSLTCWEN
ncbi:type IV pilin protein [Cognaticolwellia mytili]|uniref:type IV pilin protein n=1 Tax=Cognaticolwellia mytili TaxID=1888913 RepID=UPI001B80ADD1|nr:type IV pilin protein [Cognaticolwellia mytili]